MKYYKVGWHMAKSEKRPDGESYIIDELYTESECKKLKINFDLMLPVRRLDADIYYKDGRRFASDEHILIIGTA